MQLSKREKRLISVLVSFIGVLAVYFIIVAPLIELKSGMDANKQSSMYSLQKLDHIYNEYRQVKSQRDHYERLLKNNKGVSSLIEENAQKAGILSNKTSNRDSQANIQNKYKRISSRVKFEGVNIKSAFKFIYLMENSDKLIKVSSLRIKQAIKAKSNYDVDIKFDSYKLSE